MPYQPVLVRKLVRFARDEAHAIAAALRDIAEEARQLTPRILELNAQLEAEH